MDIMEECEVKYIDINPIEIEKKLISIGAKKQFDRTYRRIVFDYPGLPMDKDCAWLRLRDEGDKITLGYKKRINPKHDGSNDDSMEEVEVEVSDYDKTVILLEKIGLIHKFLQENRRIRYTKDDLEYDIEFWPEINPYIEIEAPSWERVDDAIKLLELDPKDKKIYSNFQIYKMKGIDLRDYSEITFEGMKKKQN
jgi:adenylate cyclase class 2